MHVGLNDPMVRHMLNQLSLRQADWLKESQTESLKQIIQASLKAKSDQELIRHYERFCRQAKEYTALQRFVDKHCNRWKREGSGTGYCGYYDFWDMEKDIPPSFQLLLEGENYVKIWADEKKRAIIFYSAPDLEVFSHPDQATYLKQLQELEEEYGEDEDEDDDVVYRDIEGTLERLQIQGADQNETETE